MANEDNFTNLSEVIIGAKYYNAQEKKRYLKIKYCLHKRIFWSTSNSPYGSLTF